VVLVLLLLLLWPHHNCELVALRMSILPLLTPPCPRIAPAISRYRIGFVAAFIWPAHTIHIQLCCWPHLEPASQLDTNQRCGTLQVLTAASP
jgi:hypothetical protein